MGFYGMLINNDVVILTDEINGKPIVEAPEPSEIPYGYVVKRRWVDLGDQIAHVYDLEPEEGTPQEAALELSKLQFKSLPDEVAYEFRALGDAWIVGQTYYGPSDPSGYLQSRVLYEGQLYKCLQTHSAQADWAPNVAVSLWAIILPGQEGSGESIGEWVRPESTNGYSIGDKVTYNGHLWESTDNDNVWKPGDVGAPWTDLGEYPAS